MKKIIIAVAFMLGVSAVNAQSFEEGTSVVQLGIGVGGDIGTPFAGGYEYGISDKIGVGATVGYSSYDLGFYKYTSILLGAKGNYHFYTTDKFDAYGGLSLIYNKLSADTASSPFGVSPSASGIVFVGQLGARYYFTDSIGAFAELGYGLANLNVGVAIKL
jgi:hypothetical protein